MTAINNGLEKRGNAKFWSYRFSHNGVEYRKSTGSADIEIARAMMLEKIESVTALESGSKIENLRTLVLGSLVKTIRASTIGAAGEKLVCVDLMNKGFAVFEAASPNSPCDLVAVIGRKCIRIEVKVGEVTRSGRFDHNPIRATCSFDVLALVTRSRGILYKPSIESILGAEERSNQALGIVQISVDDKSHDGKAS